MIKKMIATTLALVSVVAATTFGIVYFSEPEPVEAASTSFNFPAWRGRHDLPVNQLSVESGDCLRFGVAMLNTPINKSNGIQSYYDNEMWEAVTYLGQLQQCTALEVTPVGGNSYYTTVFYGFGGGFTDRKKSSYYDSIDNYVMTNHEAAVLNSLDGGYNSTAWFRNLKSIGKIGVKKIYYKERSKAETSSPEATFKKLYNNIMGAYPTYTSLLKAFYGGDLTQLEKDPNFVVNLVNNCGLSQAKAEYAMGYWLGAPIDRSTDNNDQLSGAELNFRNACTGALFVEPTATGSAAAYKRMISLLAVYVVSIRAGAGDVDVSELTNDYFGYDVAIKQLVDPTEPQIKFAPCIESTIEIVYNHEGMDDDRLPAFNIDTSDYELSESYKMYHGAWTFKGTDYEDRDCTITLTVAQQACLLSGTSDVNFCTDANANDTVGHFMNIMNAGGISSPWSMKNRETGMTVGRSEELCAWEESFPKTTLGVWGYVDYEHEGVHWGIPNITHFLYKYYDTDIDLALRDEYDSNSNISSLNDRKDARSKVSDFDANVTVPTCVGSVLYDTTKTKDKYAWVQEGTILKRKDKQNWYAAISWLGRDGHPDICVDFSKANDMKSLFTMYQYVYGFNMYYRYGSPSDDVRNQARGYGGITAPGTHLMVPKGRCDHPGGHDPENPDEDIPAHRLDGDYTGYCGVCDTSVIKSAETKDGDISGRYMTAFSETDIWGYQCYVTGAVWDPAQLDLPDMIYTVKSEVVNDNPAKVGSLAWEYGYLDNDTFTIKNTVTLKWDADSKAEKKKLEDAKEMTQLIQSLKYYGYHSGLRVRVYTEVEDDSNYCDWDTHKRWFNYKGHYKSSSTKDVKSGADPKGVEYIYMQPTGESSNVEKNPNNIEHKVDRGDHTGYLIRYLNGAEPGGTKWFFSPKFKASQTEELSGKIFPGEKITNTYKVNVDIWYGGCGDTSEEAKNSTKNYEKWNKAHTEVNELTVKNEGNTTVQLTRTTQYFKADSGKDKLAESTNELKEGTPGNERYEAMAGVPTINAERQQETLYFSVGGQPYALDITYHIEFNKTLNGYKQCNYLKIDSCKAYMMDSAKAIGVGDLLTQNEIYLPISDNALNSTINQIGLKFIPAKAVPQDTPGEVRIYGDSIRCRLPKVYDTEDGNSDGWKNLFRTYYDADYDSDNTLVDKYDDTGKYVRDGYDSIRTKANEKTLGITKVNSCYKSVWDSVTPERNSKSSVSSPHKWKIGTGVLGGMRGYNGKQGGAHENYAGLPIYVAGLPIQGQIPNKKYGAYDSSITYAVYEWDGNSQIYTKDVAPNSIDTYISKPKYLSASSPAGKTNEVVVQDPIAVKFTSVNGHDNFVSYITNVGQGEPTDQRVSDGRGNSITNLNHLFIDYDFAFQLDYTSVFGCNGAANLESVQSSLGKGFSDTLTTSPWINYVWIKFPFKVSRGGEEYEANTWITLESNGSLDKGTTTKTYSGFHIPLAQPEINDGTIEVKVQGFNSNNTNPVTSTDAADYNISNKVRNNDGTLLSNRQAHNTQGEVDIVGHIGALTMLDTGDFRFSNYFKEPTNEWLVDGLVKRVDLAKQNGIIADPSDVLRKNNNDFTDIDPYNSLSFDDDVVTNKFPLTTSVLSADLQKQPIKLGYSLYMSLETVGNYYGTVDAGSQVQIKPRYYYVTAAGVQPVDVYLSVDGVYELVNEHDSGATQNSDLYEYFYTLDWLNEKERRMYTTSGEPDATGTDEPSDEKTVHIGHLDYIFLRDSARTYFGNQGFKGADAGDKQAQRWHFTLGLPSGSIFVPAGQTPKIGNKIHNHASNILDGSDGGYVLCTIEVLSQGNVWTLKYDNIDLTDDASYNDIPIPKPEEPNPDNPNPDKPEIPVIPLDPSASASSDLSTQGTH